MDVIIAGAGIGGLALAHGLVEDGHAVRVLERAPALRTDGAAVTIFSNGAAAAAGLGVPIDGLGGPIDVLEFCRPDGRPFSRADLRVQRRRTGFGVATVPRAALLRRFTEALPAGTVTYGHEVTGVGITPDGVTVAGHPAATAAVDGPAGGDEPAGGQRAGTAAGAADDERAGGPRTARSDGPARTDRPVTADVLVGADGYRSAVRRAVLADEPAARTGWTSWQGLTRALPALAAGTRARCVVGPAGLCGLMPAGDGLLQWWFDVDAPAPSDRSVVSWLRERFAAYTGPVAELLAGLTDADVQEYPHVLHKVPSVWGVGPSTLLGDAAHAFPPSQAQGANQALDDAWLLRRALASGGEVTTALRGYEAVRARRVRRISRLAASEVTNRPPSVLARLAGRLAPAGLTARVQLAVIRSASSVLTGDGVAAHPRRSGMIAE